MPSNPEIVKIRSKLDSARAALLQAIADLPAGQGHPGQEDWSVRDILAHVGFAEEANIKLAQLMLERDNPVQLDAMAEYYPDFQGPFTLDRFNAYMTEKMRDLPLAEVLDRLQRARAATLAWIDTLTPEQLERRGQHAVWGEQTVRTMLRILALHDKMHTQDVSKLVSREP